MCDYSLQHVATRAAKVGDLLVTTKFNNSITRGFAEVGEPNVAVCILPGTELAFDRDVECDHALGFFPTRKLRERVARFRQINMDNPYEHHDALEFPSGQVVLLHSAVRRPERDGAAAARVGRSGRRRGRNRGAGAEAAARHRLTHPAFRFK